MKKNYFLTLLLICFTAVSFGQTVLMQETFETGNSGTQSDTCNDGGTDFFTRTDGSDISGSYQVTGQEGTFFFAAMDLDGDCNSATQTLEFNDIDITGATDLNLAILLAEDDDGSNQDWDTADSFMIEYDIDNSGSYTSILSVTGTATNTEPLVDGATPLTSTFTEFVRAISGTGSSIDLRLTFTLNSGDEDIAIDNIRLIDGSVTSPPTLAITAPANNMEFAPGTTSVDVTITVDNFTFSADNGSGMGDGTGDGYIKQTLVTPSGTFVESKFDSTAQMVSVADGESFTITMELVDNSGVSLSPAVSKTTNFSVASTAQVADIAALRSGTEDEFFQITGGVVVTYITGNSRNQIYIQDASGGMLIDDQPGTITTSYSVGDEITGLKGQLDSFSGFLQFKPTEDPGGATATGQSFSTTTVSMADYIADVAKSADMREYASEWITINNASFDDADGTTNFDSSTTRNYGITEGTNTMVMRLQFDNTDIENTLIPTSTANITGIAGGFNTTAQIYPVELSSIVLSTKSFDQISGFSAFPNPAENVLTVSSFSSDEKQVTVYNVLGKKVFSTQFTGTQKPIDISSIKSGIYILKVIENNKIATKKLVVK